MFFFPQIDIMPGGRPRKYVPNQNIQVQGIYNNHTYGLCTKCCLSIKANEWDLHLHPDWDTQVGNLKNQQLLKVLLGECSELMTKVAHPFLNQHFPTGIEGKMKDAYLYHALKSLFQALTKMPVPHKSKRNKIVQELECENVQMSEESFRELVRSHVESMKHHQTRQIQIKPIFQKDEHKHEIQAIFEENDEEKGDDREEQQLIEPASTKKIRKTNKKKLPRKEKATQRVRKQEKTIHDSLDIRNEEDGDHIGKISMEQKHQVYQKPKNHEILNERKKQKLMKRERDEDDGHGGLIDTRLDKRFPRFQYQVSSEGLKLKSSMNAFMVKSITAAKLAKQLSSASLNDLSLMYILKTCFICQREINEPSGSFRQCISCKTRIHQKCLKPKMQCLCDRGIRIPVIYKQDFTNTYQEPHGVVCKQILSERYQGVKDFTPKTNKKQIEVAEQEIIEVIEKERKYHYTHVALAPIDIDSSTNALRDPFLFIATSELASAYQRYKSKVYKAPVKLVKHDETNYGIAALEDIPRMTLICEYAADILPSRVTSNLFHKEYIMLYGNGRDSDQELIITIFCCSGIGPLINHHDNGNCSSLRTVINNQIRVLIYSKQKIAAGQELLYNYNGQLNTYPTAGFKNLMK